MSKKLQREKHFLELLLTTDRTQARALMETVTQSQVEALVEIFTNLMRIKVPQRTEELLKKRQRLIKKLVNKRTNFREKYTAIRSHMRQVYDTLLSAKSKLLELLRCL